MKARADYTILAIVVLAASPLRAQGGEEQDPARIKAALSVAKVSLVQAIELAGPALPEGLVVGVDLLPDEKAPMFLVKLLHADHIREVKVDVRSGMVRSAFDRAVVEEHKEWARGFPGAFEKTSVVPARAIEIAEQRVRGATAYGLIFRLEEGDWICSVSLLADGKAIETHIDLASGKVLENEESKQAGASWGFDKDKLEAVPADWIIRQTHPTTALAVWKVIADQTAPSKPNVLALRQTENIDGTFNLAIAEKTSFKNIDLSVKVKSVSGKEDQGGGPVWRCKDENNYYICRLNPLESNFRVYLVKDGVRKQLESTKVESVADKWYTIRVRMIGKHIACELDGKEMLKADDETFAEAGMIGLWTKADAVTSFDDLDVSEVIGERETAASQPAKQ